MNLSAFAGNAGEYFTVAQLLRMGWHAALTARGSRAYDVLAQRGPVSVSLRVKSKTSASRSFQWSCKKSGEIFLDLRESGDFTILVEIPEAVAEGPTFYVVPTTTLSRWLIDDFDKWIAEPGRKRPHDSTTRLRVICVDDREAVGHGYIRRLEPFRNAWNLLEEDVASAAAA